MVFLPSNQSLLTDDAYTSFASQGRMLVTSPRVVADAVDADPALGKFVVSVTPVLDRAAAEYGKVVQKFRLALFGALAGMLVLLMTGIGAVLIHTRRNAQWIFARHVSGWRFVTIHRALLAFEAIALVVVVGWLPYQAWSVNREIAAYQSRDVPAPIQPMVLGAPEWIATGLLAALTVAGLLIALTRAHGRVVRDGASEA